MGFFNPLHGLIETKNYPHARAYRTSFWQKVRDTFGVFSGSTLGYRKKAKHLGFFDYLTLGIHYYIQKKLYETRESTRNLGLLIVSSLLHFLWCLPRIFFGLVMTFLSMPGILLATIGTISGTRKKEELLNTAIQPFAVDLYLFTKFPTDKSFCAGDLFYVTGNDSSCLYYIDDNKAPQSIMLTADLKTIQQIRVKLDNDVISFPPMVKIPYLELKKYLKENTLFEKKLAHLISNINTLERFDDAEIGKSESLVHIKLMSKQQNEHQTIKVEPDFYLDLTHKPHLKFFETLCALNIGNVENITESNPITCSDNTIPTSATL